MNAKVALFLSKYSLKLICEVLTEQRILQENLEKQSKEWYIYCTAQLVQVILKVTLDTCESEGCS